jgi:hypothetical protein
MALKAYKERTFKAKIVFEDESTKEVEFRLPKNTDLYTSADGNSNLNVMYTLANMAKPFSPIQVELADGSILNATTLLELIELGVTMNYSEAISKWFEERDKAAEERNRLIKKSKSDGGSIKKDTLQDND